MDDLPPGGAVLRSSNACLRLVLTIGHLGHGRGREWVSSLRLPDDIGQKLLSVESISLTAHTPAGRTCYQMYTSVPS